MEKKSVAGAWKRGLILVVPSPLAIVFTKNVILPLRITKMSLMGL